MGWEILFFHFILFYFILDSTKFEFVLVFNLRILFSFIYDYFYKRWVTYNIFYRYKIPKFVSFITIVSNFSRGNIHSKENAFFSLSLFGWLWHIVSWYIVFYRIVLYYFSLYNFWIDCIVFCCFIISHTNNLKNRLTIF